MLRSAGLALVLSACVAPPLGIGNGAHVRPSHPPPANDFDWSTLAGSVGVGIAPNREVVQVEGSLSHRFGPRFSLEYGAALTQLGIGSRPSIPAPPQEPFARSTTDPAPTTGTLVALGILPYVRPRWQLGALSIALGGMVMLGGGGEEGAVGMFADAQIGVGGKRWSIYAGTYGLGYIDSFGTYVRATQARLGAEVFAAHVGIAIEAFTGLDAIQLYEEAEPTSLRFTGAAIKLRFDR